MLTSNLVVTIFALFLFSKGTWKVNLIKEKPLSVSSVHKS